jgi:glycosyltransferase involved in cell wall biosynthesis
MTCRSLGHVPTRSPTFDLVVATLGRVDELGRLLDSLEAQTYRSFRVLVADQNADGRLRGVLAGRGIDIVRVTSAPGLARARNVALPLLSAEVVAFPDDDCAYPPTLLERVAHRLDAERALDGLSLPMADAEGRRDTGWGREPTFLTAGNVWNLVASAGLFLRRALVERVGRFDEELGAGGPGPWRSSEETDFVIRALEAGARIAYDPTLTVEHELTVRSGPALVARGRSEGASVGYLLRKHRYPPRTLGRMVVRPVGGVVVSLARRDPDRARFHAATLAGRIRGYAGARRSNSSA